VTESPTPPNSGRPILAYCRKSLAARVVGSRNRHWSYPDAKHIVVALEISHVAKRIRAYLSMLHPVGAPARDGSDIGGVRRAGTGHRESKQSRRGGRQ